MELSRRELILLGLGLVVTGCTDQQGPRTATPEPLWPERVTRPTNPGTGPGFPGSSAPLPAPSAGGGVLTPPPPNGGVLPPSVIAGPIRAIPRSSWAKAPPVRGKIYAMDGVDKITVHHEGWTPVWFSDAGNTAERLEQIRKAHLERLGAGDIGYHYIIDRAGRIWQGRDVRFQGAHVHECNPHNIGVMCLGNFDVQRPTDLQLTTLRSTLVTLQRQYHVPLRHVYTHQELKPTECPGTDLQARMTNLRRGGLA